eukprot:15105519-Alexandrium_andersonii.AAC.1
MASRARGALSSTRSPAATRSELGRLDGPYGTATWAAARLFKDAFLWTPLNAAWAGAATRSPPGHLAK